MFKKMEKARAAASRKRFHRRVIRALALKKGRAARSDGLSLRHFQNRLQIEWRARHVHPWDQDLPPARVAQLFAEQCLDDTNAALEGLFANLREIDVIEFRVLDADSIALILSGSVSRADAKAANATSAGMKLKQLGVKYQLNSWRFEPLG
jgi:hypothetical protein